MEIRDVVGGVLRVPAVLVGVKFTFYCIFGPLFSPRSSSMAKFFGPKLKFFPIFSDFSQKFPKNFKNFQKVEKIEKHFRKMGKKVENCQNGEKMVKNV